jgi:hypothetical protein
MKYFLLLVVLLGCNPTKQAKKLIEKHPDKTLPVFRSAFPCTDERIDTVYNWHDTTIFIDCVPIIDTVKTLQSIFSPFKVKKVLSYRTATITKHIEDSSRLKSLKIQLSDSQFLQNKYFDEAEKYKTRANNFFILSLILLSLLLISIILNVLKLRV